MIKPQKLKRGDTVALVSPSSGGPNVFPHVFELGIKRLEKVFGLKVKEYPTARMDNEMLHNNPKLRADDINNAFADPEVKAIIASIGGDDSVRILPFLDKEVVKNNPKILMGYSDTTTLTTLMNQLGLVSFNGPAVMAGFAEQGKLRDDFTKHLNDFFFGEWSEYEYKPYEEWTEHILDWAVEENLNKFRTYNKNDGWRFLQGNGVVEGELFGGCIEVLEMMKGTDFWPTKDFWQGKILFFETSEDKPTVDQVKCMLRNYGAQGIFDQIAGILFGRARDYTQKEKEELDKMVVSMVANEWGNNKIPIITNMDFGHTDPQFVLPLGVRAQINYEEKSFKLLESPFKL